MNRASRIVLFALSLLPSVAAAQKAGLTTFAGTVVDSAKQALSNAEVSLPGLGFLKTTNGDGVFRIEGVTPGVHRVTVKHIGYGQLDTVMTFGEAQNVEWRVTLGRITMLDSVVVAARLDPMMAEFESNRARGFGRFMTRADLAKFDGVSLDNVARSMSGVNIMRTNLGASYIVSKRGPSTSCVASSPMGGGGSSVAARRLALEAQERTDECLRRERLYYVPEEAEKQMGVRRACYPLVYVGRDLMNSGRPTPPFDLQAYATEQIEAIEWYESAAQVPPKYSMYNPQCGVLILHLRTKK